MAVSARRKRYHAESYHTERRALWKESSVVFAAVGCLLLCRYENVVVEKSHLFIAYVVVCNAVNMSLRTSDCSARFTQAE
jgi:hypothetical protein